MAWHRLRRPPGSEDVTTSEELRAWAVYDRHADVNALSYTAWSALSSWRTEEWGVTWADERHRRTFALLVACALEDES